MFEEEKRYEPVKISPVFKNYLWGGEKLALQYHKQNGGEPLAESWELSTHKDGQCKIQSDLSNDVFLFEYIQKHGFGILGNKAKPNHELPILIKLLDAKDDLSIQVHPDNAYANEKEMDNGKTEMWVILESEPDAFLYYGVNKTTTKDEMETAVSNGTVLEHLRKVSVRKGDIFFIPAGTIHAIGKGIVICEIQQCSNVTYRLYDFERTDKEGNKRELHIKKALDVAILEPQVLYREAEYTLFKDKNTIVQLLKSCQYFNVYRYRTKDRVEFASSEETFVSVTVFDGEGFLAFADKKMKLKKGETVFIPAQEMAYQVIGEIDFLVVTL